MPKSGLHHHVGRRWTAVSKVAGLLGTAFNVFAPSHNQSGDLIYTYMKGEYQLEAVRLPFQSDGSGQGLGKLGVLGAGALRAEMRPRILYGHACMWKDQAGVICAGAPGMI